MADSDVIRKLHVYRALYRLNRAFAHVTRNLDQLLVAQVFKEDIPNEDHPHGWQDQIAEIQAEINRRLTENLHGWSTATSCVLPESKQSMSESAKSTIRNRRKRTAKKLG